MQAALMVMTDEVDGGVCWQCGAPADPGCMFRQDLVAYADQHADPWAIR